MEPSTNRISFARIGLAAAAGALPLAVIVVALVLTSGGSAASSARFRATVAKPPATSPVPAGQGAVVALLSHPTAMLSAPDGHRFRTVGLRTPFGSPTALWVVSVHGPWLGVVSELAGNGRVGWIDRGAATLSRVDWQIQVSLGSRRLTVLEAGRVLERYTVAIGQPDAPTPTGRFAVTDRLLTGDPTGPYGCCILALSALAPHAIQGWSGGNRIAIHSTVDTGSIGQPVSHGCIRLTLAEGRWLLAHVPLGTPTLINA